MIATVEKIEELKLKPEDRVIKLKPYQDSFIFNKSRYLAMMSAWGTGKTMCLIEKAKISCEEYPGNLGLIVRKEFTDLQDSTMRDWESYTGMKINSSRNALFPNKSMIMFRHAEELTGDNLSNMNLGFVGIEQAEEFDSDEFVFKLAGRLRRADVQHWLAIIGNTRGHNWIYKMFKVSNDSDYLLVEATSFDNEDVLPPETIADWKKMKDRKPKIYNRFVLNSWDDDNVSDNCINPLWIQRAKDRKLSVCPPLRRIVGVDVARKGNDKTVMYALENNMIIGKVEYEKKDTMEVVGYLLLFAEQHKNIKNFSVDELNAGAGVVDRLNEMKRAGSKSIGKVIAVNSASKSNHPEKYRNIRAEIWGYGAECFEMDRVQLPIEDNDLCEQLSWANWKSIDSNKVLQVEEKEDIIKRYGRSPDNADAYLYGLWGLKQVDPVVMTSDLRTKNGWKNGVYVPLRYQPQQKQSVEYY